LKPFSKEDNQLAYVLREIQGKTHEVSLNIYQNSEILKTGNSKCEQEHSANENSQILLGGNYFVKLSMSTNIDQMLKL
jgi:hypothetical protein